MILLSNEQVKATLLSVGCALTHETDYLWLSKVEITFSLTISNIFIVASSEPVNILLESYEKEIERISLLCGLNETTLSFFYKFTTCKSPLLLPVASNP